MQMSVAEIKRVYSQAKHKKKQVSILADLNGCSLKEILEIVHTENPKETEIQKEEWVPDPEQKTLIDRLEELNREIRKLEIEYEKVAKKLCDGGYKVESDRYENKISGR